MVLGRYYSDPYKGSYRRPFRAWGSMLPASIIVVLDWAVLGTPKDLNLKRSRLEGLWREGDKERERDRERQTHTHTEREQEQRRRKEE